LGLGITYLGTVVTVLLPQPGEEFFYSPALEIFAPVAVYNKLIKEGVCEPLALYLKK